MKVSSFFLSVAKNEGKVNYIRWQFDLRRILQNELVELIKRGSGRRRATKHYLGHTL